MKAGLFWYYLEENTARFTVRQDIGHPCMPFRKNQDNGYLIRVLCYRRRISVEFFHSLTDGTGGLVFLKTLLAQYLILTGHKAEFDNGALDPKDSPSAGETLDAFTKIALPHIRVSRKEKRAFHYTGTREISHTLHLIAAGVNTDTLCAKAKEKRTECDRISGQCDAVLRISSAKERAQKESTACKDFGSGQSAALFQSGITAQFFHIYQSGYRSQTG